MKKISTSTIGVKAEIKVDDCRVPATPRPSTIAFLRQFARAYIPTSIPEIPGIVLN